MKPSITTTPGFAGAAALGAGADLSAGVLPGEDQQGLGTEESIVAADIYIDASRPGLPPELARTFSGLKEFWSRVSGDARVLRVTEQSDEIVFELPDGMSMGEKQSGTWRTVNRFALELIFSAYIDLFLGGIPLRFTSNVFTGVKREGRKLIIRAGQAEHKLSLEGLSYLYGRTIGRQRGDNKPGEVGAIHAISLAVQEASKKIIDAHRAGGRAPAAQAAKPASPPPPPPSRKISQPAMSATADTTDGIARLGVSAITALFEHAKKLETLIADADVQIGRLQQELVDRPNARAVAEATARIEELNKEIELLRRQHKEVTDKLAALEIRTDTATTALGRATNELQAAMERERELSDAAERMGSIIRDATEFMASARTAKAGITAGITNLEGDVAAPIRALITSLGAVFGPDTTFIKQLMGLLDAVNTGTAQMRAGIEAFVIPGSTPVMPGILPQPAASAEAAKPAAAETPPSKDETVQSRWEELVRTVIAPKILAESKIETSKIETLREDLEFILNEAVTKYVSKFQGQRGSVLPEKAITELGLDLLDEWHAALDNKDINYNETRDRAFRSGLQSTLISFAEANLPRKYHVARLTGSLRSAGAELSQRLASTAAPAEVLSAIAEFETTLSGLRGNYAKLKIRKDLRDKLTGELDGVETNLRDLKSRIEGGGNYTQDELSALRQAIDKLVKASCEAEKKQESDKGRPAQSAAQAQPSTSLAAPAAPAAAAPELSADEMARLEKQTDTELLEALSKLYPTYVTQICGLTVAARRSLYTIYLVAGLDSSQKLVEALFELQTRRKQIARLTLEAIDTLSQFSIRDIVDSINRLKPEDKSGRAHELIRAAVLMKAGIAITAINKMLGPVSYQGYDLPEGAGYMVPSPPDQPLTNAFEADALDADGTAYEFKSMQALHSYTQIYLTQMIDGDPSIYVNPQYAKEARHAQKLFNQIRRYGEAVQVGSISRLELHISASVQLSPKFVDFIQRTIPNVKIVQYRELDTPYSQRDLIPDSAEFHWEPAEAGTGQRFKLVMDRSSAGLPLTRGMAMPPVVGIRGLAAIRRAREGEPVFAPPAAVQAPPPPTAQAPAAAPLEAAPTPTALPVEPAPAVALAAPAPAPALEIAASVPPPVLDLVPAGAPAAPAPAESPVEPAAPASAVLETAAVVAPVEAKVPPAPAQPDKETYRSAVQDLDATRASIPDLLPQERKDFGSFVGALRKLEEQISALRSKIKDITTATEEGWSAEHAKVESRLDLAWRIGALISNRAVVSSDIPEIRTYSAIVFSRENDLRTLSAAISDAQVDGPEDLQYLGLEAILPKLWQVNKGLAGIEALQISLSDSPIDRSIEARISRLHRDLAILSSNEAIEGLADGLIEDVEYIIDALQTAAGIAPSIIIKSALHRAKTMELVTTTEWKDMELAGDAFVASLTEDILSRYTAVLSESSPDSPAETAALLDLSARFNKWIAANPDALKPKEVSAPRPWETVRFDSAAQLIDKFLKPKKMIWTTPHTNGTLNADVSSMLQEFNGELDKLEPSQDVADLRRDINALRQRITTTTKPRSYFQHGSENELRQDGQDLIDIAKRFIWLTRRKGRGAAFDIRIHKVPNVGGPFSYSLA